MTWIKYDNDRTWSEMILLMEGIWLSNCFIFPDGEGCRININPQPFEGAVSSTWLVKPLELGACVGSRMVGCLVQRLLKSKESRSLLTLPWSSFFSMHFFLQTTWIYAMWHSWIPLAVSMVVYHVEFTRWPTSEMLLGQFGSLASWDSWDVASCACCDSWDSSTWGTGADVSLPMRGNGVFRGGSWKLGRLEHFSPVHCEASQHAWVGRLAPEFLATRVTGREVSWSRASSSAQAELWCLVFLEFGFDFLLVIVVNLRDQVIGCI